MVRYLILFVLFSSSTSGLFGQAGVFPQNLTSSRSVVLLSIPEDESVGKPIRGDWKKLSLQVQTGLKKIGVDGIYYIYEHDFSESPELRASFVSLFSSRQVKNFIYVTESGSGYDKLFTLKIVGFSGDYVQKQFPGYELNAPDMDALLIKLGRIVLREQTVRSNFLITDQPEFLDDIPFYTGSRYENYPSRLKSVKIAVILFPEAPIDPTWDEETKRSVTESNTNVQKQNARLTEIMTHYPYPYALVQSNSPDQFYKDGYQYTLAPILSTGRIIRQYLDYKLKAGETNYVSVVANANSLKMDTYHSGTELCKYYIHQTAANDIHVGSRWDAAPDWESALVNFIQNMSSELK